MQVADFKHWIFDLDGTLTMAVHDFNAIREALGLPKGKGILESLQGLPEPERSQKRQQLDEIEKQITRNTTIAPGVLDFITHLHQMNLNLGILTRNNHTNVLLTLENIGLSDFFRTENIISRDQAEPKPSPAGVQMLLKGWQAAAAETVIVGDFRDDFIAGKNAGIKTIYVDYRNQNLWNDFCHLRVGELTELLP